MGKPLKNLNSYVGFENWTKFLQKRRVALTVIRTATTLCRVLPVYIEPIQTIVLYEGDNTLNELGSGRWIANHLRVLGGTLVPATHGHHALRALRTSFRAKWSQQS